MFRSPCSLPALRAGPCLIDELENRRLFSVSVTEGYPGFYEISSDDSGDVIAVSISQGDHTLTLNDTTYSDVAYLCVQGNGGDDQISVLSTDGSGDIAAGISGGDGDDSITLNFDGGVWGGEGNDTIALSDSFYGVAMGEGGDDVMNISGACVSAEVRGGDGNDLIDCSASQLGLVIRGEAGDDTIYGSAYDDQIYGDDGADVLVGGAGNDTFYVRDGGNDTIDGGDGNDIGRVDTAEGSITNVEEIMYC
jgi:Ca2+-binding RTX toxin-like protein